MSSELTSLDVVLPQIDGAEELRDGVENALSCCVGDGVDDFLRALHEEGYIVE